MVIDDRGTSFDTSRAPSAHSSAVGGLYAPPGRQNQIPPVPTVPAHLADPNMIHRDNSDRYVRDDAFREGLTLGRTGRLPPQQHITMPEPHIPESPYSSQPTNSGGIGNLSDPVSEVSALSSGNHRTFPYQPTDQQQYEPINQTYDQTYEEMPPSPMVDGGYMEADNGFIHGPLHGPQGTAIEPPMMPLPMPPEPRRQGHSRGRSNEDFVRLPISHSNEFLTIDRREATPGYETIRLSKKNPNVSVQVRVNPDGKSVTVRRIPTDEAERDRRERVRQRAERAQQREMSMDRDRQARRSGSVRRSHRSSSVERPDTHHGSSSHIIPQPAPGSAVSTTIAGHSGGLLGSASVIPTQPSRNQQHQFEPPPEPPRAVVQSPANQGVPLPGWSILGGGLSPSQRGSVVSAGTAENSELEQEMAKDYRRKKRREERSGAGGASSLGVGGSTLMSSSIGYGDDAEDGGVQWT